MTWLFIGIDSGELSSVVKLSLWVILRCVSFPFQNPGGPTISPNNEKVAKTGCDV